MMTIDQLNSRFGAPGRIVFREGFAGFPTVVIASKYGAAEIALYGGNVLSYRPTGHSQVLFRPAKKDADYTRGESFHGGIPVCWPQFGNKAFADLPQHGFARHSLFSVQSTEYTEEKTEIVLALAPTEETRKIWPHDFALEFRVSVTMKLNLSLKTTNLGPDPFAFSCGFHPYFLVRDRNAVEVRGLDGCAYVDGTTKEMKEGVWSGNLNVDFAPDHIFSLPDAPRHAVAILDPSLRRAIAVASSGNSKCVVWNVGETGKLSDGDADDWRKFVCVEPVSQWPGAETLESGATHELVVAIQAHLEGLGE